MDTGLGNFARVSEGMAELLERQEDKLKGKVFRVGEIIKVKESEFRVSNISRHTLSLRLIPDDIHQQIPKGE